MTNVLMQVESEKDLMQWNSWFSLKSEQAANNSNNNHYQHDFLNPDETCINPLEIINDYGKPSKDLNEKLNFDDDDYTVNKPRKSTNTTNRLMTRQIRLDSGITTHHLLGGGQGEDFDDDERRGSEMTLASCYNQPVMTSFDYGVDEVNRAGNMVQQQFQQQVDSQQTITYSPSMVLGSITDEEHRHTSQQQQQQDSRVSFYSSFAGYLSNTRISNMEGDGGGTTTNSDSSTTVIATPISLSDIAEEDNSDSNSNSNSN